jgi:hypothetical protein
MPPTRELLGKIALITGDARADPNVRAVAWSKLETYHQAHSELFVVEPPPIDDSPPWGGAPSFRDVAAEAPPASNPDREAFFDRRLWRHSAAGNLWRLYRGLTVTVFADLKFGGGRLKWCVSDSAQQYSRRHFTTKDEAMLACWVDCLAPRFGLAPERWMSWLSLTPTPTPITTSFKPPWPLGML